MVRIRDLVIALVYLAAALALASQVGWFPVALCVAVQIVTLVVASSLPKKYPTQSEARRFWATIVVSNFVVFGLIVYGPGLVGFILAYLYCLMAFVLCPLLWGRWYLESRRLAADRVRGTVHALPLLALLLASLVVMLATLWPMRLAFTLSRPWLDRLADRVESGESIGAPAWAGLFSVIGSDVDPDSGNVALILSETEIGLSGFVRMARGSTDSVGPIVNLSIDLPVGDRWRYQAQD
jgi:hypothetical protein